VTDFAGFREFGNLQWPHLDAVPPRLRGWASAWLSFSVITPTCSYAPVRSI